MLLMSVHGGRPEVVDRGQNEVFDPQRTRGLQGFASAMEFRSSDRALFPVSCIKLVYESASLDFIDER